MANLKQIEDFLKKKNVAYNLVDLGGERFSVDDVVEFGVDPEEVVKTLIVRTNDGFKALCLRGIDRLDFKKVKEYFGNKTQLAKPEEVLQITGVPIGAVCPVLIGVPVFLDKKVMDMRRVHLGSGKLDTGLEMKSEDMQEIIKNKVLDLRKGD